MKFLENFYFLCTGLSQVNSTWAITSELAKTSANQHARNYYSLVWYKTIIIIHFCPLANSAK